MLESLDNKLGGVNVQLLCFLFIRIITMMVSVLSERVQDDMFLFLPVFILKFDVFGILTASITLILFISYLEIEGSGCKRKL